MVIKCALKSISNDEVLKLAMNLEEEGRNFYLACNKGTRDDKAKRLFERLADFEKEHLASFSRLHQRIAKKQGVFATPDDALVKDYINALIDPGVFKKNTCPVIGADKESVLRALEFAKNVEKDSILFYVELRSIASCDETKKLLDAVIKEEEHHLIDIDRMIKELES